MRDIGSNVNKIAIIACRFVVYKPCTPTSWFTGQLDIYYPELGPILLRSGIWNRTTSSLALSFGTRRYMIYIIDFSMVKVYRDQRGLHIPWRTSTGFWGNPRYVSVGAHEANGLIPALILAGFSHLTCCCLRAKPMKCHGSLGLHLCWLPPRLQVISLGYLWHHTDFRRRRFQMDWTITSPLDKVSVTPQSLFSVPACQ